MPKSRPKKRKRDPSKAPSTRNRAKHNAFQRDYKKAVKLGMTVAEYRLKQKESL